MSPEGQRRRLRLRPQRRRRRRSSVDGDGDGDNVDEERGDEVADMVSGNKEEVQMVSGQDDDEEAKYVADIPHEFLCPISLHIMKDPVMSKTGQNYDRQTILQWFNEGNVVCPLTRQYLKPSGLVPNVPLKTRILQWKRDNRISHSLHDSMEKKKIHEDDEDDDGDGKNNCHDHDDGYRGNHISSSLLSSSSSSSSSIGDERGIVGLVDADSGAAAAAYYSRFNKLMRQNHPRTQTLASANQQNFIAHQIFPGLDGENDNLNTRNNQFNDCHLRYYSSDSDDDDDEKNLHYTTTKRNNDDDGMADLLELYNEVLELTADSMGTTRTKCKQVNGGGS